MCRWKWAKFFFFFKSILSFYFALHCSIKLKCQLKIKKSSKFFIELTVIFTTHTYMKKEYSIILKQTVSLFFAYFILSFFSSIIYSLETFCGKQTNALTINVTVQPFSIFRVIYRVIIYADHYRSYIMNEKKKVKCIHRYIQFSGERVRCTHVSI